MRREGEIILFRLETAVLIKTSPETICEFLLQLRFVPTCSRSWGGGSRGYRLRGCNCFTFVYRSLWPHTLQMLLRAVVLSPCFSSTGSPSQPSSLYGCCLLFGIWHFCYCEFFQQNSSRRAVMDCSKPQSNRTEGACVSFSSEIIQQKALLKVGLLSNKSSFMTQRLEGIQRRATETILGLRVELEGIC